jgi:hypothetical protein
MTRTVYEFSDILVPGRDDINIYKQGAANQHTPTGPVSSRYATTFNGCQGLTLQKAVLDLRTDSFAHGQLYIALRECNVAKIFEPCLQ